MSAAPVRPGLPPIYGGGLSGIIAKLTDRVVSSISPSAGATRLKARAFMAFGSSYIGSSVERRSMRDWFTTRTDATGDTLSSVQLLRDRSRDLVRNNPLAAGAISTVVENVVGSGLTLQARPDNNVLKMTDDALDAWTENVQQEFSLWAESADCDLTATQNFYQLSELAFRSMLEAGDVIVNIVMAPGRGVYETRVQLIEAERCTNPVDVLDGGRVGDKATGNLCFGGVEIDTNGAPVAYHVRKAHPYSWSLEDSRIDIRIPTYQGDRRAVLHVFERKRVGQYRGVPYLACVIEPLKQLDRYCEAELMAAVVSAMFTVFIKTETGESFMPSAVGAPAEKGNDVSLGSGSIISLASGEDVAFANPQRPSSTFEAFFQAIIRQVGVALGVPYEVLIKHFTASYSAARAAMLEAWKFYRARRSFVSTAFCQPVYEAWLDEAVLLGRVPALGYFTDPIRRRAFQKAEWIGDAPPQIDPVKDVEAAKTRLEINVSTLEDETMQLTGKVWSDQVKQRAKEHKILDAAGLLPPPPPAPGAPPVVPGKPPAKPEDTGSDIEKPEAA